MLIICYISLSNEQRDVVFVQCWYDKEQMWFILILWLDLRIYLFNKEAMVSSCQLIKICVHYS